MGKKRAMKLARQFVTIWSFRFSGESPQICAKLMLLTRMLLYITYFRLDLLCKKCLIRLSCFSIHLLCVLGISKFATFLPSVICGFLDFLSLESTHTQVLSRDGIQNCRRRGCDERIKGLSCPLTAASEIRKYCGSDGKFLSSQKKMIVNTSLGLNVSQRLSLKKGITASTRLLFLSCMFNILKFRI